VLYQTFSHGKVSEYEFEVTQCPSADMRVIDIYRTNELFTLFTSESHHFKTQFGNFVKLAARTTVRITSI